VRTYPLASRLLANFVCLAGCGGDGTTTSASTGDSSGTGDPGSDDATSPTSTPGTPTTGDTTDDATGDPPVTTTGDTSTGDVPGGSSDTGDSTGAVLSTGDDGTTGDTTGTSDTTDSSSSSESSAGESSSGDEGLGQDALDIAAELAAAVDGVLYTSEGEDIWHVVTFADVAPVTAANLKEVIKDVYVQNPNEQPLVDRTIEVRSFPWLMDPITVPKDWWDDGYYEQAEKYVPIRAVFEMKLENLQVFRLGEKQGNVLAGAIDVYVLGETPSGDVVGMWSTAIET